MNEILVAVAAASDAAVGIGDVRISYLPALIIKPNPKIKFAKLRLASFMVFVRNKINNSKSVNKSNCHHVKTFLHFRVKVSLFNPITLTIKEN